RCKQHPLARPNTLKTACKSLDDRAADNIVPSLGLHINHVESKLVLFDDPIDTAVTTLTDHSRRIFERSAVAHCHQQVEYELLEETRRQLLDLREQFIRQRLIYLADGSGDRLFRR